MRKKMPMVGWFDPGQLIQTAIRVLVSTVFGQFADKREALAAANPISDDKLDEHCDYEKKYPRGDLWFDYLADTGDGWNPTYAIARLLARKELRPRASEASKEQGERLQRGRVLILGGDQVYPTSSPEEYDNRLRYPFDEAGRVEGMAKEKERPDLFAVPGNHDWYDGLRTFFHLFCRRTIKSEGEAEVNRPGNEIGGRRTHQTRSYFALKLPHGWWLWGTDSQLEGYIDQPQVDFFQFVAQSWMKKGSKLILCTGTPDWEYVRAHSPERFDALSYLERLAPAARGKNHKLKLVLSGDSHHYARFQEQGLNYITCGGGGAFLHPTHQLPKEPVEFKSRFPRPGEAYDAAKSPYPRKFSIGTKQGTGEEALYPDRKTSSKLTSRNLFFAIRNWKLTVTLALGYAFFIWLLDFNARVAGRISLPEALETGSLWDAIKRYWEVAVYSPWTAVLLGLTGAAYYYFADVGDLSRSKQPWWRLGIGSFHALIHAVLVTVITCLVMRLMTPAPPAEPSLTLIILSLAASAIVSALVSATVIGLYLWICLSAFGLHWGHLSSLAIQGYKCFLRLHIGTDGALTVYPIGLTKVPDDRGWFRWRKKVEPHTLDPHLIEPGIRILP